MNRERAEKAQVPAWAFLLLLFYLPLAVVIGRALLAPAGRTALLSFLGSAQFRRVLGFTLWQSLLSAAGSLIVSLPGAYILGRYEFRGKRIMRSLLVLPFVLPGIVAVLAMVAAYGRNGLLNQALRRLFGPAAPQYTGLYGLGGIVLTHVFFNFALGIRLIGEAWERLDRRLLEAASSLGAGPFAAWRTVVLPLLRPAMAASFVLAFIYSSLSFTAVLVFGGWRFQTFEVLIYTRLHQDLDFTGAYAVAAVQLALAGMLLALNAWTARRRRRVGAAFALPAAEPLPRGWSRLPMSLYGLALLFFYLGPLAALLLRAWRERGAPDGALTGANFSALLAPGFRAGAGLEFWPILLGSLGLAAAVGCAVTVLAYFLASARGEAPHGLLDTAVELPLGASVVTVCFGLLILYGFLPSLALVFVAQVLMGLPIGYMILRTARADQGPEIMQAARSLGASPWRARLDVELPLLRRALLTAFAYAAAFSLGDITAVLTLGQGRVITLAVAVYRLMGHYRFAQALALGCILLLLSLGLFLAADRLGEQNRKGIDRRHVA